MQVYLLFCLLLLVLAILYQIIKSAVRNGVEQANKSMLESVRQIEKDIHEIKMGIDQEGGRK